MHWSQGQSVTSPSFRAAGKVSMFVRYPKFKKKTRKKFELWKTWRFSIKSLLRCLPKNIPVHKKSHMFHTSHTVLRYPFEFHLEPLWEKIQISSPSKWGSPEIGAVFTIWNINGNNTIERILIIPTMEDDFIIFLATFQWDIYGYLISLQGSSSFWKPRASGPSRSELARLRTGVSRDVTHPQKKIERRWEGHFFRGVRSLNFGKWYSFCVWVTVYHWYWQIVCLQLPYIHVSGGIPLSTLGPLSPC